MQKFVCLAISDKIEYMIFYVCDHELFIGVPNRPTMYCSMPTSRVCVLDYLRTDFVYLNWFMCLYIWGSLHPSKLLN